VPPRAKPRPGIGNLRSISQSSFLAAALKANPRDAMKKAKSNVDVSSLQDDINMKAAFKYNPILEQQVSCNAACSLLSLTKVSYKGKELGRAGARGERKHTALLRDFQRRGALVSVSPSTD